MGWEDFNKNCQFVVGLGNRVRFWQDVWYGDQPFQLALPRLYGIAIDKEVFVEASLSRQGAKDRRIWDVRFIREFNDWEMDEGLHFLHILGANTPPIDVGDWMRWKLKPSGDFDIRSIPDLLFGWWNWLGKHSSQIWNLVLLCIFWCIWKERNRRTFEDLDSSGDQMLASFSGTLFDWSRAWRLTTSDSLPSFLSSLSLCN
uniref:Reverse transcriptase zinc-binding domain-containing protein n=1 Tax=Quercus lobata TaxID=97700 RepID=A0A7N2L696_QUELO